MIGRTLWFMCGLLLATAPAGAQDSRPAPGDVLKEMRALRARIETLEKQNAEDRKADRKRITELESQIETLRTKSLDEERLKEYAEIAQNMRDQQASEGTFEISPETAGYPNIQNPAITAFFDLGGSISSRGRNEALNRFNLREAEVDIRAAISPDADGVLILSIGEEIEQMRNGQISVDRAFDIEEGYVDFHSLPWDLSLRVGKMRNHFGRNNPLHTHDLPQVTRPLAVKAFFGGEGMATTGAALTWLVPNPWDKFIELRTELVNADGGTESPILGGPNAENPAIIARLKYFDDLTETSTLELGTSFLWTRTSDRSDFDANVFGADVTYQWIDPDPSTFHSWLLQGELFIGDNDVPRSAFLSRRNNAWGAYAFGQYQINRNWYAGARFDYTQFPNSELRGVDDYDIALSPYLTYYMTEFLRLRTQFEHRISHVRGRNRSEEAVFVQLTFVIGSHPPHPYWVNR